MTTTSFLCQTKQKSNFSNNYYVKKNAKKRARKKTFMKISRKNYFQKSKKFKISINMFAQSKRNLNILQRKSNAISSKKKRLTKIEILTIKKFYVFFMQFIFQKKIALKTKFFFTIL